jgi:hypothetical protein
MSKKALLNENQVRQMMKLASIGGPLTSNFLSETYAGYMDEDEDDTPYGVLEAEEDELGAPDMAELPEPAEAPEDAGPEDVDPEMDLEAPADDVSDKETKFASAIATLADLAGVEVDFGDAMGDMGDADAEDVAADLEDLGDMGEMGDETPAVEEEPLDEIDFIDEEEVMREVYKRVKGRLKEKLIANK